MCPKTVIRVLETTEDTLQYSFGGKGVRRHAAKRRNPLAPPPCAHFHLFMCVRRERERESGKSLEGMNNLSISIPILATFLSLEVDRQLVQGFHRQAGAGCYFWAEMSSNGSKPRNEHKKIGLVNTVCRAWLKDGLQVV